MRSVALAIGAVPVIALAALAGPVSAVAVTGPGDANVVGVPVVGDIDNDGLPDRISLGGEGGVFTPPSTCSVEVEPGLPGGGYGPATTATYDLGEGEFFYCADLGVVVDLGGDGSNELVLGFFDGGPIAGSELLALRDFELVGGFAGQFQPSGIGLADFNGDELVDVWEVTDQGDGLSTFLNTRRGELVAGPARLCGETTPVFGIADVNGNGTDDIVGSSDCDGVTRLVKVGGRTGTVTVLESDLDSAESYGPLTLTDVDGDRDLDAVLTSTLGDTTYLNKRGTFTPVPFINETFSSGLGGIVAVAGGTWGPGSKDVRLSNPAKGGTGQSNLAIHTTTVGGDVTIKAKLTAAATSSTVDDVSLVLYYVDPANYVYVNFAERNTTGSSGVFAVSEGVVTELANISKTITAGKAYTVTAETTSAGLKVKLGSSTVANLAIALNLPQRWGVGFGTTDNGGRFDDLSVVRRSS